MPIFQAGLVETGEHRLGGPRLGRDRRLEPGRSPPRPVPRGGEHRGPLPCPGFRDTHLPAADRPRPVPEERFKYGQWDYFHYYCVAFDQVTADFEANVAGSISVFFRRGIPESAGQVARTALISANGGWFGTAHRAPDVPRDEAVLSEEDFAALVQAFTTTGFRGANSWYLNDQANLAYAATAPGGGRLQMPVLFVHARWDPTCRTLGTALAEPMRADCGNLTEAVVDSGHYVSLENPQDLQTALESWLSVACLK